MKLAFATILLQTRKSLDKKTLYCLYSVVALLIITFGLALWLVTKDTAAQQAFYRS